MLTSIAVVLGFSTFILTDPEYYNISKDDIGEVMGTVGTIDEFFVICLDLACGPIFDLIGRKWPIVIGIFLGGISMCLIPMFTSIYPWFLICRIIIHCGGMVYLNVPLLPDYV
jgi:MFS family permease